MLTCHFHDEFAKRISTFFVPAPVHIDFDSLSLSSVEGKGKNKTILGHVLCDEKTVWVNILLKFQYLILMPQES